MPVLFQHFLFALIQMEHPVYFWKLLAQQELQQQSRQWTRPSVVHSGANGAQLSCSLCRTNGECRRVYESHGLKDD